MTVLFKPLLIETAEQAEALPIGTVAVRDYFNEGDDYHHYDCARKIDPDTWFQILDHDEFANGLVLGWTALVPIEAEEEFTAMGTDDGEPWIAHVGHGGIDGSHEEAEAYTRRFGGFVVHRALTGWEEA